MQKPDGTTTTLVPYLLLFGISWAAVAIISGLVGNGILFLALNRLGNPSTDFLFRYYTYVGDGAFMLTIALLVMAWHRRSGLALLAGFALSALLAQVFKNLFFDEWVRPKTFFEAKRQTIHLPAGVEVFSYNSFPSGHSTTAFCMACLLAFIFPKPVLQIAFLVMAWLVALSRIMLAQHFPFDVLAGALLGTVLAVAVRRMLFKAAATPTSPHSM